MAKSLAHPYTDLRGGEWLRGNLHAHTTRSDGAREAQAVADDYARRGYAFLMLSDHDTYTSSVEYAELNLALHDRGLVLIPGNEITSGGPHLLHVDADRRIEPHPDRQQAIDEANSARGFIIVNHPNWQAGFDHCSMERLREWSGYLGMEIYNGVVSRLEGSPYALEKWETLLSEGRCVWGFANDDSHEAGDVALGWNVAYVPERTCEAVVAALRAGRFYASTGVEITNIEVTDLRVRLETSNAQRIVCLTRWGRRLQVVDEGSIEMEVPPDVPYIRFECWGYGERFAWTQPFRITER